MTTKTVGTYAVVQAGVVTNVILWDGDESGWEPPGGATMVPVPIGTTVEPGFSYKKGSFSGVLKSDAEAAAMRGE